MVIALTRARLQSDIVLARLSFSLHWLHGDLFNAVLPYRGVDLWHDRALFHFFITEPKQTRYLQYLQHALHSGGSLIMATFARNGPMH